MNIFNNMKAFIYSILFSGFFVGYLVCADIIETCLLIILTMFIYIFAKNIKKVDLGYFCTVITGILIGCVLSSYGLYFLEYKDEYKDELIHVEKKSSTAVLLIYEGEPKRYDIPILLENIKREGGIKSKIVTPFKLYKYKKAYDHLGTSRYRKISKKISEEVSKHLDEGYDVFNAYLNDRPSYETIMKEKIIEGNYEKIIAVPVFLTESDNYKLIFSELEKLSMKDCKLKIMTPLWNSEKMVKFFTREVCRNDESERRQMGIILVGENDKNRKGIEIKTLKQQKLFAEKIRNALVGNGFKRSQIKFTKVTPSDLDIKETIEELQQFGVHKILLLGINDLVDKIENQYEIDRVMAKFKDTEIEYIKGFGESELFVDELEFRIRLINIEKWNLGTFKK